MNNKDFNNILFLRHFKTEYNLKNIKTGQKDIDIVEFPIKIIGIEKIDKNAIVFLSPMKRCIQTMSYIEQQLQYRFQNSIILDELKERHYGIWENKSKSDIIKNYPAFFKNDIFDFSLTPPEGESYSSLVNRINIVKKRISQVDCAVQIIICSHNHLMKMLASNLYGITIVPDFKFLNGNIYDKKMIINDNKELN